MKKKCGNWISYILLFVFAFLGGIVAERGMFKHNAHSATQVREDRLVGASSFQLINPLLECELAEGSLDAYKVNFKEDVQALVDKLKKVGGTNEVALYFRDLNNGPTFGIDDNVDFIPASLLKVPVMMSYFYLADSDPQILSNTLELNEEYSYEKGSAQLIRPQDEIKVGTTYSIGELIDRTIRYSDNQAVSLLIEHLPPQPLRHLYAMLGVREDVLNGPSGQLTVKEYAAFFRILFNSSYLSRTMSERALMTLTDTKFDAGIVSGVPKGVTVAHKFGEGGTLTEHQIHDCGIVYYPGHPYLLCIMTKGDDIKSLTEAIGEVSKLVYEKIDQQYGKAEGR